MIKLLDVVALLEDIPERDTRFGKIMDVWARHDTPLRRPSASRRNHQGAPYATDSIQPNGHEASRTTKT